MAVSDVVPEVTGYQPNITLYATKYRQGDRKVFALDLSLIEIADLLPEPDPDKPTEGNRRIKESHRSRVCRVSP